MTHRRTYRDMISDDGYARVISEVKWNIQRTIGFTVTNKDVENALWDTNPIIFYDERKIYGYLKIKGATRIFEKLNDYVKQ